MRIVFMGSALLACPSLDALLGDPDCEVVGIVTQPDRPRGRRLLKGACPVRERAAQTGVPVLTPEKASAPESCAALADLAPDLIVVVAYGQILRRAVLDLPPEKCVNVHASLLPKYRGAAPIQWAIVNGEARTGVTTMYMDERLDAGDIILQRETPIEDNDTAGTLHDRLARLGAEALAETVRLIREGRVPRVPQDDSAATLAPKLKKCDGAVDWSGSARDIRNRVRGFHPWPGCFAYCAGGKRLKILRVELVDTAAGGASGEIVGVGEDLLVATGDGVLRLLEVQPEGGKIMSGAAYLHGHALKAGGRLCPGMPG